MNPEVNTISSESVLPLGREASQEVDPHIAPAVVREDQPFDVSSLLPRPMRDIMTAPGLPNQVEESLRTIMSGTGDIQGKIDALLELLHQGSREQGTFDFQKTSQTIINGRVLLALKQCIRQVRGVKWSTWADEHIPDLSERTRQIWMTLGKCGDAREFAHLGEDRLLRIIRRQRSTNSRLSIGAFLEDHSIEQAGGEASLDLKVLVDRALRRPRGAGRRRGVQASPPPPPFNELLASLQNQARELISQGPDGLAQVDREALTALETTLAELRANIST